MTIILSIFIGVLLAKAASDICLGLLRILACLATLLLGASFYLLAEAAGIFSTIWMTTPPVNRSPYTNK